MNVIVLNSYVTRIILNVYSVPAGVPDFEALYNDPCPFWALDVYTPGREVRIENSDLAWV